ncbi:hypothetical protein ABZZ36_32220 [Actinacidiphila glaucinigra]|uniref:hypothetical protein n=1 Tax=Actinacidiphila glaucinigra TaxID=235986 RepID=UPI0033ADA568
MVLATAVRVTSSAGPAAVGAAAAGLGGVVLAVVDVFKASNEAPVMASTAAATDRAVPDSRGD